MPPAPGLDSSRVLAAPVPGGGEPGDAVVPVDVNAKKRLIVYTAQFSLIVEDVERSMKRLLESIDEWDGYVQNADLKHVTFRVPAANFDRAVEMVSEMGEVFDKLVAAEDVTRRYRDLQLRIDVAEESRKRMMAILQKADLMRDIIEIENEIRRLTQEIESMKAELRTMGEAVAYSTITVYLTAKPPPPPPTKKPPRPRRTVSYFDWINTIGVEHVQTNALRGQPSPWSKGLCLLAVLVGGGATFKMPTPENFVLVQSSDSHMAALTAQEDKLLVRHQTAPHKGSLDFWAESVRNNLVKERGYTLIDESAFKTDDGRSGHQFDLETTQNFVHYRLAVVLFTTRGRKCQHIYTIQFLCEAENYDKNTPAFEKALRQFVPKRPRSWRNL